jgi:hypothetical protein
MDFTLPAAVHHSLPRLACLGCGAGVLQEPGELIASGE